MKWELNLFQYSSQSLWNFCFANINCSTLFVAIIAKWNTKQISVPPLNSTQVGRGGGGGGEIKDKNGGKQQKTSSTTTDFTFFDTHLMFVFHFLFECQFPSFLLLVLLILQLIMFRSQHNHMEWSTRGNFNTFSYWTLVISQSVSH